ncbi:radical SAM protein [Saccharicrinis aurantiacus]|uniref:radical SAM protein n=1 Tax=Saccharicrinis aurantiacus TaxID=1849719 RepID=UPI002491D3F9|nr:hypothetical protein [Saccharicrinis aurantiacus]
MGTFLFSEIIFGPIKSRRLGISLGVNLLPTDKKVCTFDCIYCECGFNPKDHSLKTKLPSRKEVATALKSKLEFMLSKGEKPDVITFAGNGEPTIHPEFAEIIDDTIALRDEFCKEARVAVLSNATVLHKPAVVAALSKIEDNILKLDGGLIEVIKILDQPNKTFSLEKVVDQMVSFRGNLIIQTMFVKGEFNGVDVDNTTEENVDAWLKLLSKIKPKSVMLYSIDRDTPAKGLIKVGKDEMDTIAERVNLLGIQTQVSG